MVDRIQVPEALSSDMWSWQRTINKRFCKTSDPFPIPGSRWASVSTSGTHNLWQTEGLCTLVEIQNEGGLNICFVAAEREGGKPFSALTTFLGHWDVNKPSTDRWDVEAMVLAPGVKL